MKKKQTSSALFGWPEFDWRNLNSKDFSLYFEGSLFKIRLKDDPDFIWARITAGGAFPEVIYLITEKAGSQKTIDPKEIEEFDFSFPPAGAYNYKNTVIFFSRTFARQWSKGITKRSAVFEEILGKYFISSKLKPTVTSGFALQSGLWKSPKEVSQLFNCKYSSFEEAYGLLEKKKVVARAMNREIVLSLGAKTSSPLLWIGEIPVGTVESPERPTISLYYPNFEEDLKKIFPNSKLNIVLEKETDDEVEVLNVATTSPF